MKQMKYLKLYHDLGENSILIGWRVSINFLHVDTNGTP